MWSPVLEVEPPTVSPVYRTAHPLDLENNSRSRSTDFLHLLLRIQSLQSLISIPECIGQSHLKLKGLPILNKTSIPRFSLSYTRVQGHCTSRCGFTHPQASTNTIFCFLPHTQCHTETQTRYTHTYTECKQVVLTAQVSYWAVLSFDNPVVTTEPEPVETTHNVIEQQTIKINGSLTHSRSSAWMTL